MPLHWIFLVALLSSFAAGCERRPNLSGTWTLWSIEGIPVEDAPVDRFDLPPSDHLGLGSGDIWTDSKTIGATLTIYEEGEYREVHIASKRTMASPGYYQRLTGRVAPNNAPQLVQAKTDTTRIIGPWRVAGNDSLILHQSIETVRTSVLNELRRMYPDRSEDDLRSALNVLPDTAPDRARGRFSAERIEVTDLNGRLLVYRRVSNGS